MILCEPDCQMRHPGCHDRCDKYKSRKAKWQDAIRKYRLKNADPYCRHRTHKEILRELKEKR